MSESPASPNGGSSREAGEGGSPTVFIGYDRKRSMRNAAFTSYIGENWSLSQLRFSGVSLITARHTYPNLEISGCGMRGAGRCGADAPRV